MAGYPPPYAPPPPMMIGPPQQQRPFGVTLLAILYIVDALMIFATAAFISALAVLPFIGGIILICAVIIALFGVFALLIAIGLLKLQKWARTTAIIFAILGIILGLLSIMNGTGIITLIINIIALYYLEKPEVKAAFGAGPPPMMYAQVPPPAYGAPPPGYATPPPPAYGAPPPAYGAPSAPPAYGAPPVPPGPPMNCRYCGAPVPPGSMVCPRCGGRL